MLDKTLHEISAKAGAASRAPDYAGLVRRAHTRRRRRRVTVGVGVAALGAAVAVLAVTLPNLTHDAEPGHDGPTPATSPHSASTVQPPPSRRYLLSHPAALVHQPDASISGVSYADVDHAAALWSVCSAANADGICPEVLTWTSNAWQTSRAMLIPDKVNVYALPDGSVVVWLYGSQGFIAEPDGSTRKITFSRQPVAAAPGGRLTNLAGIGGARPAGMLDLTTATVHEPLTAPSTRCVYDDLWDAHGRVWEYGTPRCGPGHTIVAWSSDLGATWSSHDAGPAPILGLAVAGDRTAVLLGSTEADGNQVLHALDVTSDGGHTWRHVPVPGTHLGNVFHPYDVYSTATTQKGQLLMTDGAGLWVANRDWTAFHHVNGVLTGDDVVIAGDNVVCVWNSTGVNVSTDDGETWHSLSPRP